MILILILIRVGVVLLEQMESLKEAEDKLQALFRQVEVHVYVHVYVYVYVHVHMYMYMYMYIEGYDPHPCRNGTQCTYTCTYTCT